jgi:hypothetical protein
MEFTFKEFNKNIGCWLVVIFIIVLILFIFTQLYTNKNMVTDINNNVVEGLSNMGDPAESDVHAGEISQNTSKVIDELLVEKYRTNYEDILNNLKIWSDVQLLKALLQSNIDTSSGLTSENLKKISNINNLESFSKTCQAGIEALDNN